MKLRSIVFAMTIIGLIGLASCNKDESDVPELTTSSVIKFTNDSIQVGGTITTDGDEDITAKGICWSTSPNPTVSDNKTNEGAGDASFTSTITGLQKDTTYYFRAYASNSVGTGYGQEVSFSTSLSKEELFEQMLTWMCGSFSSENHADTTVNQYIVDVRLHMAQIWSDRNASENIYWLYVEQAYASSLSSPYRQRIYKMMMDANGDIYDEVYAIPNPSSYLHSYTSPSDFDNLTEADLTIKDGCDVYFEWNGDYFEGETQGTDCTTAIPGIAYIQSYSTIRSTWMTSWDLGYAANGAWVMGPDWPYIFDKLSDYNFMAH